MDSKETLRKVQNSESENEGARDERNGQIKKTRS